MLAMTDTVEESHEKQALPATQPMASDY